MTVPASVVRVEAGERKARIEAAGPSLNGRFITYRGGLVTPLGGRRLTFRTVHCQRFAQSRRSCR
jgi:hypothetical protein